jgi:hypothetical protein
MEAAFPGPNNINPATREQNYDSQFLVEDPLQISIYIRQVNAEEA